MRSDMHKVIVERPRPRSGQSFSKGDPLRKLAWDELPSRESMKARHSDRRSFNENLNPLRRWLGRQVGRPWDLVYSEACGVIRPNSTVKNHVKTHLLELAHRNVVLTDGVPMALRGWSGCGFAELNDGDLYVHPGTGILQCHRRRRAAKAVLPEAARLIAEEPMSAGEAADRHLVLAGDERAVRRLLLRKLHGLWHEIEEYEIQREGRAPGGPLALTPYNPARHIRIRGRQMNRRELRKAQLFNEPGAPFS
jgi:hypothetical protein